jgi:hypothetical protein
MGLVGSSFGSRVPAGDSGRKNWFGRVPFGIYLVAILLGLAGFLGAVACDTPWFSESGTIPGMPFHSTFTVEFAPGPSGYVISCIIVLTTSNCVTTAYDYDSSSGTGLLVGLYVGLLAAMAAAIVLSFLSVIVIAFATLRRMRLRRARSIAMLMIAIAIICATIASVAMPALQGPALHAANACSGYNGTASPCTSLSGHASGVGCHNGTCVETNVSWQPIEGWYFAIASGAVAAAALVVLRFQPLGAPCPTCGVENSFRREFCDSCGSPLPVRPKTQHMVLRP